jgi:murein DD-endopeptidase MepM/ murein hydrolase activator NlpD
MQPRSAIGPLHALRRWPRTVLGRAALTATLAATGLAGTATAAQAASTGWAHPMPGSETTSCFGPRWGTQHAGLDLAAAEGTPVYAVGAGTVVDSGWLYSGYGISVLVDHGDGTLTHYAHLREALVSAGDAVTAGQQIGGEGSTGDSTGPHLHFEVHAGMWNQIDPGPWMAARGVDLGC